MIIRLQATTSCWLEKLKCNENKQTREKCCTFHFRCVRVRLRRELMLDPPSSLHSLRLLVAHCYYFIAKRYATCMHYVITCICFVNYYCSKEIYIISCFIFISIFVYNFLFSSRNEKKKFCRIAARSFSLLL